MPEPIPLLNAALEGRYRIERELGEGGMATVYLADDLRHERKVALKVLKPELAAVVGGERFLAEIKMTANLTHPHILPLHDSGEAEAFLFYVMPHVHGESLRDRLDRERQLPVEDAVTIATNLAEALDYAHRQGVIHRDIKPANVLLLDGKPVLSDFGIALAVTAGGRGRLTETGLSLGTPHYMSPEQATGDLKVGPATDIYALGCVLYEMLVGEPPYTGSTPQAVLGKIITGDVPSARAERSSVPANVDAVVARALEKLPADRFAGALDLAGALGDPSFRYRDAGAAAAEATRVARRWTWGRTANAAALVSLGALSLWLWLGTRPLAEQSPLRTRTTIPYPEGHVVPLPFSAFPFDLSEDGSRLTFVGVEEGQPRLYVRGLDSDEAVALDGTEGARHPFLSPGAGEWIGFFAEGELRKVSVDEQSVQRVAQIDRITAGASWGPDGSIVYVVPPDSLYRVDDEGGVPQLLEVRLLEDEAPDVSEVLPDWGWPDHLPGGGHLLINNRATVAVIDMTDLTARRVLDRGALPIYTAGHLVVGRGGRLVGYPFDLDRLDVTGPSVTTFETPRRVSGAAPLLTRLDRRGNLVYLEGGLERSVVLVDRAGREERVLTPDRRGYRAPSVSPDGSEILVSVQPGPDEIWAIDVARGLSQPLLRSENHTIMPVWHPDGRRFAVRRGRELVLVERATLSPGRPLSPGQSIFPISISGDGEVFVNAMTTGSTTADTDLRWLDLAGDSVARPLLEGLAREENPQISPDGRYLAYTSDRTGTDEIYVASWPEWEDLGRVSLQGGREALWSRDGTELFFLSGNRVMAVDVTGGFPAADPIELFRGDWDIVPANNWDVTPDGKFVFVRGPPGSMREFRYVSNWVSQLRNGSEGSEGR